MDLIEQTISEFSKRFEAGSEVVGRAPGRLELIGNHTDYNGGHILAAAIDLYTAVAARKNNSSTVRLYAMDLGESIEFDLGEIQRGESLHWSDYTKGVIVELRKAGAELEGFDAVIHSNIPIGMGLSSSAALELASASALKGLFGHRIEGMELANLCVRAENDFCGASVGILDQFCAVYGKEKHVLFLDCLTMEHDRIELNDADWGLVVADSAVEHSIVEGKYSLRHDECSSAASLLGKLLGREIKLLREVSLDEFNSVARRMPRIEQNRARHIIEENQRVLSGVEAARAGDIATFGRLIFESHHSSSVLFENSCPELDKLVKIASRHPAVLGAKLSGGGFGGCTANLVRRDGVDDFVSYLEREYEIAAGKRTRTITCAIGGGAAVERI
jgi:galactokinase